MFVFTLWGLGEIPCVMGLGSEVVVVVDVVTYRHVRIEGCVFKVGVVLRLWFGGERERELVGVDFGGER